MQRYESEQFWILDSMHWSRPMLPFESEIDCQWWPPQSEVTNRVFVVPAAGGLDHRLLYGWPYLAPIEHKDPKVIEERSKIFEKRTGWYFQNWPRIFEEWKKKSEANAREIDNLNFDDLPEIVDDIIIDKNIGLFPGSRMRTNFLKLLVIMDNMWDYHFELLNISYIPLVALTDFCRKAFPDITQIGINKMLTGLEIDSLRPDVKCQELAKSAVDLGVAEAIKEPGDFKEIEARLKGTENGRKWFDLFKKAKEPWFNIKTGASAMLINDIAWIDDLNIPLNIIRSYINEIEGGSRKVGRDITETIKQRDEITNAYRDLLPTDQGRTTFDMFVGLGRTTLPYAEGHMFWMESMHYTRWWRKMRQIGRLATDCGIFEEPNDVFYFKRFEILEVLQDLTTAWAGGTKPAGTWYWKPEIKWRREVFEKFGEFVSPLALGRAPEKIVDPFLIGLWGITDETIDRWLKGAEIEYGEMKELSGFSASGGTVEGKARVVTIEQIGEVQEGEILVCTLTSPSWGPVFSKIKGIVTDVGGVMCHTGIIAREYGIPAVCGCGYATKTIKTNYTIRVDGDAGTVRIIKK